MPANLTNLLPAVISAALQLLAAAAILIAAVLCSIAWLKLKKR